MSYSGPNFKSVPRYWFQANVQRCGPFNGEVLTPRLKQSKWHLHPGKFDTMRCSTFESTHFFNGTFEKWKTPPARDMGFLQWVIRIPMQLGSRVPYTKQATRVDWSQDIWGSISTLQEDTLSLQGTRCACLIGKCLILAAIDRTFWIHIRYFLISANQG